MKKSSSTPTTQQRASAIQSRVDRTPNPTPKQIGFKVRTARAAAKNAKR